MVFNVSNPAFAINARLYIKNSSISKPSSKRYFGFLPWTSVPLVCNHLNSSTPSHSLYVYISGDVYSIQHDMPDLCVILKRLDLTICEIFNMFLFDLKIEVLTSAFFNLAMIGHA